MTRTISLITATVGAALLFAVPANADNWGAEKAQPSGGAPELVDLLAAKNGAVDASIAGNSSATQRMLDAHERAQGVSVENSVPPVDRERALGTKNELSLASDFYADGFAQAIQPRSGPEPVRGDRFRIDPTSSPNSVTVGSGREIEWPQVVGIGLGIGLLLAVGLFAAMRFTRTRPLAH